jgi:hypothetical protein
VIAIMENHSLPSHINMQRGYRNFSKEARFNAKKKIFRKDFQYFLIKSHLLFRVLATNFRF